MKIMTQLRVHPKRAACDPEPYQTSDMQFKPSKHLIVFSVPTLPDKNNTVIQEEESEIASQMKAMAFSMSRRKNIMLPVHCTVCRV